MFIENIDATLFSENRSWYSLPHPKKGISTMLTLTVPTDGLNNLVLSLAASAIKSTLVAQCDKSSTQSCARTLGAGARRKIRLATKSALTRI